MSVSVRRSPQRNASSPFEEPSHAGVDSAASGGCSDPGRICGTDHSVGTELVGSGSQNLFRAGESRQATRGSGLKMSVFHLLCRHVKAPPPPHRYVLISGPGKSNLSQRPVPLLNYLAECKACCLRPRRRSRRLMFLQAREPHSSGLPGDLEIPRTRHLGHNSGSGQRAGACGVLAGQSQKGPKRAVSEP